MPLVQLPNNESATLQERGDIIERMARTIDRAFTLAQVTAVKIASKNFDPTDQTTWSVIGDLNEEDYDRMDGYQAHLIVGFVKSWTLGELPTLETVYDLPRGTFELLAKECADLWNKTEEFGPDGVIDPKADTAD